MAVLIAVILVIIFSPQAIKSYLNNSTLANNPTELTASWQFYQLKHWQINQKNHPTEQTFLKADKASYQNDSKTSQLNHLQIIQSYPNQTIVINSNKGQTQSNHLITLTEQVKINIIDPKQSRFLKTEKITYNSNTKQIQSNVYTKLAKPNFSVSGNQFLGNIETGEYHFMGKVKTTLRPKP